MVSESIRSGRGYGDQHDSGRQAGELDVAIPQMCAKGRAGAVQH